MLVHCSSTSNILVRLPSQLASTHFGIERKLSLNNQRWQIQILSAFKRLFRNLIKMVASAQHCSLLLWFYNGLETRNRKYEVLNQSTYSKFWRITFRRTKSIKALFIISSINLTFTVYIVQLARRDYNFSIARLENWFLLIVNNGKTCFLTKFTLTNLQSKEIKSCLSRKMQGNTRAYRPPSWIFRRFSWTSNYFRWPGWLLVH